MAQFALDLTQDAATILSQFTRVAGTGGALSVVEDVSYPLGKAVRFDAGGGDAAKDWSWDEPGTPTGAKEILALLELEQTPINGRTRLTKLGLNYVSGARYWAGGVNDWISGSDYNGGHALGYGTNNFLEFSNDSLGLNFYTQRYWLRLRAGGGSNGGPASMKIWHDGDPEPGNWLSSHPGDSSVGTSGAFTIGSSSCWGLIERILFLSAGTDGDPAPGLGDSITAKVVGESALISIQGAYNATFRNLHRDTSPDFSSYVVFELDVSIGQYQDDTVDPSVTYYYRTEWDEGFSNVASVTMPVAVGTPPATPSLSLVWEGEDGAEFTSSAYSHPEGVEGSSVELWVETQAGAYVAGPLLYPIIEGSDDWRNLLVEGLPTGTTTLRARIRHRDINNTSSEYSAWVNFELLDAEGTGEEPDEIDLEETVSSERDVWPAGGLRQLTGLVPAPDSAMAPLVVCDIANYTDLLAYFTIAYSPRQYYYYLKFGEAKGEVNAVYKSWDFLFGGAQFGVRFDTLWACTIPQSRNHLPPYRYGRPIESTSTYIPFSRVPPYIGDAEPAFTPASNLVTGDSLDAEWQEPPSFIGSDQCFGEVMAYVAGGPAPATLIDYGDGTYSVEDPIYFEFEYTQDEGATWVPLATEPFGLRYFEISALGFQFHRRANSTKWSKTFDLSGLEDGCTTIRVRLNASALAEGHVGPWRHSRPFFIDRAGAALSYSGAAVKKSLFEFFGSPDEANRWSDIVGGGIRRTVPHGESTAGFAALYNGPQLRSFDMLVTGAFTTGREKSAGAGSGLTFITEVTSAWGPAGYMSDNGGLVSAIVGRVKGQFAPFGSYRPTGSGNYQQEGSGANYWSYWDDGYRFGKGAGRISVGKVGPSAADPKSFNSGATVGFTQWVHAFKNAVVPSAGASRPNYTVRLRVTLEGINSDGSHRVLAKTMVHGPDQDTDAGWMTTREISKDTWPCGTCGVYAANLNIRAHSIDIYSITIIPIDYGDCALPAQESLPNEKAWMFPLDGHVFYVLNVINTDDGKKSYVYDLATGQWARWFTGFNTFWNMFRGFVWKGRVLGADYTAAKIWELDPSSMLDEGTTPIRRAVTGILPHRGRQAIRQGALRLYASMGEPSHEGAVVQLRFSDDGGNTWSAYYPVVIDVDRFTQKPRFRSLGRIRAPGRVWEVSDDGAAVRIDGVDAILDTDE